MSCVGFRVIGPGGRGVSGGGSRLSRILPGTHPKAQPSGTREQVRYIISFIRALHSARRFEYERARMLRPFVFSTFGARPPSVRTHASFRDKKHIRFEQCQCTLGLGRCMDFPCARGSRVHGDRCGLVAFHGSDKDSPSGSDTFIE